MIILNVTLMVFVAVAIVGLLSYAIFTSVERSHKTTARSTEGITLPAPAVQSTVRLAV